MFGSLIWPRSTATERVLLPTLMTDTSRAAPALRTGSGVPPAAPATATAHADRWLGVLGLAPDCAHSLRVRKRVPLSCSLMGEVGVAADLRTGAITRHAAVTADVRKKKDQAGAGCVFTRLLACVGGKN